MTKNASFIITCELTTFFAVKLKILMMLIATKLVIRNQVNLFLFAPDLILLHFYLGIHHHSNLNKQKPLSAFYVNLFLYEADKYEFKIGLILLSYI